MAKNNAAADKHARAQVAKAQMVAHQRAERRNKILVWGGLGLVAAAIIGATVVVLSNVAGERTKLEQAIAQPIEGVVEDPNQSANHIPDLPEPSPVNGVLLPPMGGDHDPAWQNCGIYTAPVRAAHAVHSLEHGAVWVTYNPTINEADVATLTTKLANRTYTILSPLPEQSAAIALTAWGVQLTVDDVDDQRIEVFLGKYIQGPGTPEPGAACSGAVSATR